MCFLHRRVSGCECRAVRWISPPKHLPACCPPTLSLAPPSSSSYFPVETLGPRQQCPSTLTLSLSLFMQRLSLALPGYSTSRSASHPFSNYLSLPPSFSFHLLSLLLCVLPFPPQSSISRRRVRAAPPPEYEAYLSSCHPANNGLLSLRLLLLPQQ